MSYTIKIKNDSGSVQIWAGKEFAIAEEYTVPTDSNRIKYQNNSDLLAAIGSGDALVGDGSEYFTDVNDGIDWLKGNDTSPRDADGAILSRTKITQAGYHFQFYSLEFETANLTGLVNLDVDGSSLGHATVKFYDSSDVELTTQSSINLFCTKTVLDWEPPWDYELIGGQFRQLSLPGSDVRLNVVAAPDIPAEYGGSVPFVNNVNLRFVGTEDNVSSNGRTSKRLAYDAVNHTNKLRVIVYHNILMKHKLQLMFEIFRA